MKCKNKFEGAADRLLIEKLYFQLVEISSQEEVFSEHQTAILDLYYIPVYMQTNLYTDDSFKFNQVIKEMTLTVKDQGMGAYKQEHDKLKEQFRSGTSDYVFKTDKELQAFIAGMKRWTYLDTLQIIFSQFKGTDWARSSLQQMIKNTYLL